MTPADDIAGMLQDLDVEGFNRPVSRVLACLMTEPDIASGAACISFRQIERIADLRQPEVSIAISVLQGCGYVKVHERKSAGKGRPIKHAGLALPPDIIIDRIERRVQSRVEHETRILDDVRQKVEAMA